MEDIKKIIDEGQNALSDPKKFIAFQTLFFTTFGETVLPCVGCNNGINESFNKLNKYYNSKTKIKTMANSKFKIKKGIDMVTHLGRFDNDSMTDEIAIQLLKDSPAAINSFESFPKNWQSMVEKNSTELESEPSLTPKKK